MTDKDILEAIEQLEKQELENGAAGIAVPALSYTKLLALYLYQNDLCNAKFLWKRIPATIKSSSKELQSVGVVSQKMWQRDFAAIYVALNEPWSSDIAEIMENLKVNVRQRAANLIATAYSSISLDTLGQFTGLTIEEARERAVSAGWNIDENMAYPVKPPTGPVLPVSCEEQLAKLTEFVSFLEN